MQGAPLNESDHCGDPPLLLAAGNGQPRPYSNLLAVSIISLEEEVQRLAQSDVFF
jgi:hypothetical protein